MKIIYGPKGTGKAKAIIDGANEALDSAKGHVIFITDTNRYTYDLKYQIRFLDVTQFAIQGSDIYIAYTNSGTSYLQRGTITGSNDSGFSITAKGTAQSTEQMGVAGTINDIAILYDGYVYVAEDLENAYCIYMKVRQMNLSHKLVPYMKRQYYDRLKDYFEDKNI